MRHERGEGEGEIKTASSPCASLSSIVPLEEREQAPIAFLEEFCLTPARGERSSFTLPVALPPFSLNWIMWALLKEFLRFSRQEKKWWLIPLMVILLALGAILIFTSSSGIAWALYPFM